MWKGCQVFFGGMVYFGTVESVWKSSQGVPLWHIEFDNNDEADMDENEIVKAKKNLSNE